MSIAPISPVSAALRVQLIAAAQAELMAVVGVTPDGGQKSQGQASGGRGDSGQAQTNPQQNPSTQTGQAPAPGAAVHTARVHAADPGQAASTTDPAAPPAPNPARLALAEAKVAAAARQGSAAPLFADLEQAFSAPATPAPVREAAAQLLGMRLAGPVTAESLRQAVARSGLFLEARLAAEPQAQGPIQPDLKSALLALRQVLAAVAPQAARAAAPPSLTGAIPAGPSPFPAASIEPAGAAPPLAAPQPPSPAPALAAASPPPTPRAAPAAAPPLPAAGPPAMTLAAEQLSPGASPPGSPPPTLEPPAGSPTPVQTAPIPRGPGLPPPLRDATLAAQPPAPPSLPATATADAVVPTLRQEVEQALARQTLHQLASTPDGAPGAAWMFELPIATPLGTAFAQFEIDRDGRGGGVAAASTEGWGARFSIDVEPLGPVHVHISQSGQRTAATVWAERPESLLRLRAHGEELARELAGEVVFHPGVPRRPTPASGRLLDQLS